LCDKKIEKLAQRNTAERTQQNTEKLMHHKHRRLMEKVGVADPAQPLYGLRSRVLPQCTGVYTYRRLQLWLIAGEIQA
jgi:hypothetical protein